MNGHDSEITQILVYHVSTLPLLMDDLPSFLGATNSINKMLTKWCPYGTLEWATATLLGGGFKHFYFHPKPWGNDPI